MEASLAFFFLDYYNEVIGYFFHKFQWCFHFSISHSIWGVETIYVLSFHWVIAHHIEILLMSMNLYWFLYCRWVSKMVLFVATHTWDTFPWWIFKKVPRHLSPCISFFHFVLELSTMECFSLRLFCIFVSFSSYSILSPLVVTCIVVIFSTKFNIVGGWYVMLPQVIFYLPWSIKIKRL